MTSTELCWLSLAQAAQHIQDGALSPVELTEAHLARIEALNGTLRAYLTVDAEGALAAARVAEAEIQRGAYRGPLHGIPLCAKDAFATRGLRTTAASAVYADWVPDHDAAAIERLRAAGAVLLGKANMYELGTGWGTVGYFPVAVNPWDAAYSSGGSSSGSAVAVASRLALGALGTDAGGSVRMPASFCGVTGLKPTYGRISRYGTVPVGDSAEHVGVLARSAADAALLLSALAGYDPRDHASADRPVDDYVGALTGEVKGLTVGVPRRYLEGYVSPENGLAFERALDVLRDAGARSTEVEFPLPDLVAPTWTTLVYTELAAFHRERFQEQRELFGPELAQRLQTGLATPAVEYVDALTNRARLRLETVALFERVDLIATPSAPVAPPSMADLTDRASALQELGQLARYTRPYNLTGLPAITVPSGHTQAGLPLGLELAGRPFDECTVLRAADAFQRRTGWHQAHPPLAVAAASA